MFKKGDLKRIQVAKNDTSLNRFLNFLLSALPCGISFRGSGSKRTSTV